MRYRSSLLNASVSHRQVPIDEYVTKLVSDAAKHAYTLASMDGVPYVTTIEKGDIVCTKLLWEHIAYEELEDSNNPSKAKK